MATVLPRVTEQAAVPSSMGKETAIVTASTALDKEQQRFYIFGQGISFSLSPQIHSAAFKHYGLPHTYEIVQTATVDEVAHLVEMRDFGGASVTMPHKLKVGKFCDEITQDAKAIGAINTLVVEKNIETPKKRRIIGDNTDWSGLVSLINDRYPKGSMKPRVGLVIGAGGAARAALYALNKAGISEIAIVNRTRSSAESVALHFSPFFKVTVLDSLQELSERPDLVPEVIIGTIPADTTEANDFPNELFAGPRGICMDMSYKPRITPLLSKAVVANGWSVVTGVEILLSQASDQSRIWLGRPAPNNEMRKALDMS